MRHHGSETGLDFWVRSLLPIWSLALPGFCDGFCLGFFFFWDIVKRVLPVPRIVDPKIYRPNEINFPDQEFGVRPETGRGVVGEAESGCRAREV